MDPQDKVIICEDCKKEFTHTVEDQKRYAERGFIQDPKRCRECRQVRKQKAANQKANPRPSQVVGASGGFGDPPRERRGGFGGGGRERRGGFQDRPGPGRFQDRGPAPQAGSGGGFGGGGGSGGGSGGGGFGNRPRQSFEAICSACGIKTTLPFEPRQGREVFCRDCFKKMKE